MGTLSAIITYSFFRIFLSKIMVTTKAPATKKVASHPKYSDMITAAVTDLKGSKGTSKYAILKYIKENYTVGDNANSVVRLTIKRMVAGGSLLQTSGIGASGSFKLPKKVATKAKKPVVAKKSTAAKKPSTPKKAVKKSSAKKTVAKKAKASPKKKAAKKVIKKVVKKSAKKPVKAKKPAAKKSPKKKSENQRNDLEFWNHRIKDGLSGQNLKSL